MKARTSYRLSLIGLPLTAMLAGWCVIDGVRGWGTYHGAFNFLLAAVNMWTVRMHLTNLTVMREFLRIMAKRGEGKE